MQKIFKFLSEKFQLSDNEITIYLRLLELQNATVLQLAKSTEINRITVHGYINNLIDKGLVSQSISKSRRILIPESPERFKSILEQKKSEIFEMEKELPSILNSLNGFIPRPTESKDVSFKFYESKKSVHLIYEDVLKSDEIRAYVNTVEIVNIFPENIDLFTSAHRKNKKMQIWEILNTFNRMEDYVGGMDKNRYHYKFAPTNINIPTLDYLIYNGKVAIINIKEDPYGLVIENKDYHDNAKSIFDFIWQVIPERDLSRSNH